MTFKVLRAYDFNRNEIQNAVAQVLGAPPSSPVPGQYYYDSSIGRFVFRGASAWIDPTARANHTGQQLASTISDFDSAVRLSRLDQMAAPTAPVAMGNQRITGVADGVAATDAASWGQVQNAINGTDWKQSVRVATTANLATLSGLLTIDGITLVAGDRVLVKDQATASANGLYVAASGAWSRATDADANSEVTAGMAVMVTEGTVNADTQWRLTTNDAIVLGTTALVFQQIGAGTSYTPGTGISIAGNVVAVDTAVVTRKVAATLSTSALSIPFTHNLNNLDVQVQVYEIATGDTVDCDVTRNSVNQITLGFSPVAPLANTLRVVVQG